MLGSELKKYRLSKGWTQQEMADKMHISRSAVSKIENNTQEVGAEFYRDWSMATDNGVQAALTLFGTEVIMQAAQIAAQAVQVATLIPAYVVPVSTLNFLM